MLPTIYNVTSHHVKRVSNMAVGTSGRIVIDLDPTIKNAIYQKLKLNGLTMKEWFEQKAKSDFPELFNSTENK
tara:strand:- start:6215 stop:6433 length:219 start_codon:yes stop_codon:yes gene_type:complete